MALKRGGQIALIPFPYTDLTGAKLRPVLILRKASSRYDDWLVGMISSRLEQYDPALDEIIAADDPEFAKSGLKASSVLRLSRLAVVHGDLFVGLVGEIEQIRLNVLLRRLADWLTGDPDPT